MNGQLCITFAGEEAAAGAEGAAAEAGGERDGSGGAVATAVGSSAQSRFRAALMEAASFEDLSICLGAAYCYCHQVRAQPSTSFSPFCTQVHTRLLRSVRALPAARVPISELPATGWVGDCTPRALASTFFESRS